MKTDQATVSEQEIQDRVAILLSVLKELVSTLAVLRRQIERLK